MADSILDEYRAADPRLANLSDKELIELAHKASGVGGSAREYARDYLGVKNNGGIVRDTAIDVGKGLVGIGQIATGAANLVSGGAAGNAIRNTFGGDLEDVKHKMGEYYSDARQDSDEAVQNAKGFWNQAGALVTHPRSLFGGAVETLPSMALPGAVAGKVASRAMAGAGKVAEGLTPIARAAAAREAVGATEAAVNASKALGNRASSATWGGMTATQTADRVNHEAPNDPQAMYGAATGAGLVVGGLTHGFSFIPGGHMADQAATLGKRMGLSIANQAGMMGSMGVAQTGAENIATGKPLEHGMAEALASGIINGAGFGLMGGRKRPDVDPRVAQAKVQADRASDAAARAAVSDTDFQTKWEQWAQDLRDNHTPSPTMYTTARGDTMHASDLPAYQQFGNNPVDIGTSAGAEPPKVLDPGAQKMGEVKAEAAKPEVPEVPEVTQDERNAIFAKYGEARPNYIGGKLDQHGQPLAVGHHFDLSSKPDKNGNAKPYLSPEKLQQAVDKLAIAEREKSAAQRTAEQQLSDVMLKELGRRPTSAEVTKIAKELALEHVDSQEALVGHLDSALGVYEGKTKLNAEAQVVKDAMTAWRKHLDDQSPSHVKVAEPVKAGEDAKPYEPAQEPKTAKEHVTAALKDLIGNNPKKNTGSVALPKGSGVKVYTPETYKAKMAKWNDVEKQRAMYLTGYDAEGNHLGNPLTHEQIAQLESAARGEEVTAKAISKWAVENGLTEDVANRVADSNHVDPTAYADAAQAGLSVTKSVGSRRMGADQYVGSKAKEAAEPELEVVRKVDDRLSEKAQREADENNNIVEDDHSMDATVEVREKQKDPEAPKSEEAKAEEARVARRTYDDKKMHKDFYDVAKARYKKEGKSDAEASAMANVEANRQMAEVKAANDKVDDKEATIVKKNRAVQSAEAREQTTLALLRAAESHPLKEKAKQEFNYLRRKGDYNFDELHPKQQGEFIIAYQAARDAEFVAGEGDTLLKDYFDQIQQEVKDERANNVAREAPGDRSSSGSPANGPDGQSVLQPGDAQSGGKVQQPAQPAIAVKRKRAYVKPEDAKFGKDDGRVENAYTADELRGELHDFMGTDSLGRNVIIVEHPSELADLRDATVGASNPTAFGWTRDGKAILIASRIEKGNAKAAFLHEVGAHLGIDRMLDPETHHRLAEQIGEWAGREDGSLESEIAKAAVDRTMEAGTPDHQVGSEGIAYFIEEAVKRGIDPTSKSYKTPLDRWFRTLWASFKKAIRRVFGDTSKLTAQDMVDLAYGAARLETTGTWHGAAAKFRKFDHSYMGTGEGAQVYGWGTYSAERKGVADGYLRNDVHRKSSSTGERPLLGGKPLPKDFVRKVHDLDGYQHMIFTDFSGTKLNPKWKENATHMLENAKSTIEKLKAAEAEQQKLRDAYDAAGEKVHAALREDDGGNMLKWHDTVSKAEEERRKAHDARMAFKIDYSLKADARDAEKHIPVLEQILKEGLTSKASGNPEGLLHRLDFDIKPDEWLHYDKPMGEQPPKVLDATTRLLKDLVGLKDDIDPKWEKSTRTGKDLYDYIERKVGSDKEASELLHKYGIKGSKHFDGDSRGKYDALKRSININEKSIAGVEARLGAMRAEIEKLRKDGAPEKFIGAKEHELKLAENHIRDSKVSIEELRRDMQDLTHNRVAFYDRDIQRVMGYKGGKVDQVHFGKNAEAAQLAEIKDNIDRLPVQLRKPVRGIMATIHDKTVKGVQRLTFMQDLADWGNKHGLPAMKKIADVMAIKGAYKVDRDQALGRVVEQFQKLKQEEQAKVQEFLKDSTFEQRWGYQPEWRKDVKVDAAAKAQYEALSPEAQKVADAVFRHGHEMHKEKQQALEDIIQTHYTEMVSRAEGEEVAALWKKMESELKAANRTLMEGPYAPLKRFGPQVVVVKSKALLEAKDTDGKKYREMLDDPNHYRREDYETIYAAENRRDELAKQLGDTHVVERSEKEAHEHLGAGYETLNRLAEQVKSQFDGADYTDADKRLAHATYRAINEAIIQSLGEHNARTSTLQRKYIAGVDAKDMMRGFATQGYADNSFLSAMKHNKELQDHTAALRAQVHDGTGDRTMKQSFYNELQARRAANLSAESPRWVGHAMRFTTLWKLITSPAYYLQYLSQPLTMFLPLVNGDHGYGAGNAAFVKAAADTIKISKGLYDTDLSKIADAGERKMLESLKAMGTIAIGHEQQFGQLQMMPEKGFSKVWQQATHKITQLPHSVEMHNRIASALAAYRLEMAKHGDAAKATEYAKNKVYQAYGDYSSYNAPRIMQGGGMTKLVMQYRQFQFIHTALLTRLLNNAFAGASPEEKRAARLQLTYMAGHYGVLAGALGVPAAHALGGAIKAVFGDDNDVDLETFVNRHTGNKFMADMILGGVPRAVLGQDLSSRMGAGDILSPFRYMDMGSALDSKRSYNDFMTGAMGPFIGGMMPQVVDGANLIRKGDVYRGLEQLLPKGISDVMKAYRFADEGVVDKKGQTVVNKEDVSTGTVVAQALGSRPTQVSEPQHDTIVVSKIMQKFKDQANTLKSQFVRARKEGEATDDIVAKWQKMQEKQRAAGIKPAAMSELYKSMATANKRDRMVIDGVPFRKNNRALVQDITGGEE